MGGVCAAIGSDAELIVNEMCRNIRHRGPDDEGFFVDRNLALGYRAIQIDDNKITHQPLANENETVWITFDGEIYNKEPLIQQLSKNHKFHTTSSAEVVVHAYEEFGLDSLHRFNGMFAFCLWDSTKDQLFIVRDRVGIKPLYYFNSPSQFLVASEIKALLTVSSVPRKPNDHIIYDYLMTGHHYHNEDTFFAGIRRILPDHYMIVDRNGIIIQKSANPIKPLRTYKSKKKDQDYASEYYKLLRDSVKIRLPESLFVGTFLSGGLDSTSIACLVDEILDSSRSTKTIINQKQKFFSAIYRGPISQGDEKPYIEEVMRTLGTKTNYVFPSVSGQWDDIRCFLYYVDEPVSVFNYYVFWCLSRKARENVKVVLYGMRGGLLTADNVRQYVRYFKELWSRKNIARLLIEVLGALSRVRISSILGLQDMLCRSSELKTKGFLAPRFVANYVNGPQIETHSSHSDYLRVIRGSNLDHLRVCDRVSAAFSIEPRFPFLDYRLIEFTLSLPPEQKVKYGRSKYVLRNAMKDLFPEAIMKTRKKFGTPIPLEHWMRELSENIRNILESRKFCERGYFNQPAVLKMFDRFCDGNLSLSENQYYADVLWRILNLELWLETFFDSTSEKEFTEFYRKCLHGDSK